jgi:hypothetical protein
MLAGRQIRRPTGQGTRTENFQGPKAGIGVDPYGGAVIDPTENVLALVDAQANFQEKMDASAARYSAAESAWIIRYFEAIQIAERRRINDLALLKKDYDKAISETQTGQMKTTSDLVSTQLDKVTTSLSDTINKTADNIAATLATMDKRLASVEQFRYETGGKTSVSDPVMTQIASDIAALKMAQGRVAGATEASTAQIVAETLRLHEATVQHGSNQNIIAIAAIVIGLLIAAAGWISRPAPAVIEQGIHRPAARVIVTVEWEFA